MNQKVMWFLGGVATFCTAMLCCTLLIVAVMLKQRGDDRKEPLIITYPYAVNTGYGSAPVMYPTWDDTKWLDRAVERMIRDGKRAIMSPAVPPTEPKCEAIAPPYNGLDDDFVGPPYESKTELAPPPKEKP